LQPKPGLVGCACLPQMRQITCLLEALWLITQHQARLQCRPPPPAAYRVPPGAWVTLGSQIQSGHSAAGTILPLKPQSWCTSLPLKPQCWCITLPLKPQCWCRTLPLKPQCHRFTLSLTPCPLALPHLCHVGRACTCATRPAASDGGATPQKTLLHAHKKAPDQLADGYCQLSNPVARASSPGVGRARTTTRAMPATQLCYTHSCLATCGQTEVHHTHACGDPC
jgi:hypothetical protein